MEEQKKIEAKVEVRAVQGQAFSGCGKIEYITTSVQNWNIHIWSWQQFTPFLTDRGGSLIKGLLARLDRCSIDEQDPSSLSTKRKPMNERMKKYTEVDLKAIVKSNMKELLTTINLNIVNERISKELYIDEQEVLEEDKSILKDALPVPRKQRMSNALLIDELVNWSHFWSEDPTHEFLLKRKKGQHLTEAEIFYIGQRLQESPGSIKLMQRRYWLSRATIRRISMKMNLGIPLRDRFLTRFGSCRPISEDAKQLIRNYLSPPWEPKSIAMIKHFVESELNETYSDYKIRRFIAVDMKYA